MMVTFPQMILLGHASWVTSERGKSKADAEKKTKEVKQHKDEENPIVFRGKRLKDLNSAEMAAYYGAFGADDFS